MHRIVGKLCPGLYEYSNAKEKVHFLLHLSIHISRGSAFLQSYVCAPTEDSDQPKHPCMLISILWPPGGTLYPWLPTECPVKIDQTAQAHLSLRWAHKQFCRKYRAPADIRYDIIQTYVWNAPLFQDWKYICGSTFVC